MKNLLSAAIAATLISGGAANSAVVNFESLGPGIVPGSVITNQTFGDVTYGSVGGPLVLFNSNCEGGTNPTFTIGCTGQDEDLATSNDETPEAQGLVLIVEESPTGDNPEPNPDDKLGGTFIFEFSAPVLFEYVTLLDIDRRSSANNIEFTSFFDGGPTTTVLGSTFFPGSVTGDIGDNELITFLFDQEPITRFEIKLPGSGAVAEFGYSVVPLPAGAWLMLTGLAGLGVAARRRKSA